METDVILLVEDNPDDVDLALRAFRKSGLHHTVVVARDGAEALDYLFCTGAHAGRDGSRMPRVILLDLKLPGMNGFEVLQRIRADERTRLLPVVVLTTSSEDRDIIECYRKGANSYVRKNVDFDQFSRSLHQLGSYWLGLNRVPA